jgi:phosphatidylglycerophosphatase GEP4
VGDRVFTDIVLANRMQMQSDRQQQNLLTSPTPSQDAEKESRLEAPKAEIPAGPLAIWTTGVWERENMLMRWMERRLMNTVERWSTPPTGEPIDVSPFLKEEKIEPPKKSRCLVALSSRLRRG